MRASSEPDFFDAKFKWILRKLDFKDAKLGKMTERIEDLLRKHESELSSEQWEVLVKLRDDMSKIEAFLQRVTDPGSTIKQVVDEYGGEWSDLSRRYPLGHGMHLEVSSDWSVSFGDEGDDRPTIRLTLDPGPAGGRSQSRRRKRC